MKKLALSAAVTGAILLSACGSKDPAPAATETPGATTADMMQSTQQAALGLTEAELMDADLVDAAGEDLGDVEGVVRGTDGTVTGLIVEVEGSDLKVEVPLANLTAVRDGAEVDVEAKTNRKDLMAMPPYSAGAM